MPSVFISYSHLDEPWKDRLVKHLFVLQHQGLLDVWEDRKIKGGEEWFQAIESALLNCSAAILLVSADFLISDFIRRVEVPNLLKRRKDEGMPVIPVLLKHCLWERVDWLKEMTIRPTDARPVSSFKGDRRDAELKSVAREVLSIVEASSAFHMKPGVSIFLPGEKKPKQLLQPNRKQGVTKENLFVGINGGYSSSIAVATDSQQVIAVTQGASLNLHEHSLEDITLRLREVVASLGKSSGFANLRQFLERCAHINLSLPDINTLADKSTALAALEGAGLGGENLCTILDDTWSGLVGGALTKKGICAYASVGASVFVSTGQFYIGKPSKFDGFGPLLGGFGGAFDLAMKCLQRITRELDIGTPMDNSHIFGKILERYTEIVSVKGLQNWFDDLMQTNRQSWRFKFSEIAKPILDACDSFPPDQFAVSLVQEAARSMADTIMLAIQSCEDKNLPIVCQGSMFRYSQIYYQTVRSIIETSSSRKVACGAYRSIVGSLLLAAGGGDELPSDDVIDRLLESILRLPNTQRAAFVFKATDEKPFGEWAP